MSFAEAGAAPLFATDWGATSVDGVRGAPVSALRPGGEWSWHGDLIRLDRGPDPARGALRLDGALGAADLHRMAASRVARLRRATPPLGLAAPTIPELLTDKSAFRESFVVTDGRRGWAVSHGAGRVGGGFGSAGLAIFAGGVAPANTDLWVVSVTPQIEPSRSSLPQVAGFAPGALVETPFGPTPVEALRPGDPVLTDRGSTPVRRTRLRPRVAALQIRAAALGTDGPQRDVIVGAGTWLGIEGQALPELFSAGDGSTDPLFEALVQASDLETLQGVRPVFAVDLISIEVDDGPKGAALLMVGGLPCLGGRADMAPLRRLTPVEAQIALGHGTTRLIADLTQRRVA